MVNQDLVEFQNRDAMIHLQCKMQSLHNIILLVVVNLLLLNLNYINITWLLEISHTLKLKMNIFPGEELNFNIMLSSGVKYKVIVIAILLSNRINSNQSKINCF